MPRAICLTASWTIAFLRLGREQPGFLGRIDCVAESIGIAAIGEFHGDERLAIGGQDQTVHANDILGSRAFLSAGYFKRWLRASPANSSNFSSSKFSRGIEAERLP